MSVDIIGFRFRIFTVRFLEFLIPAVIASALSVLFCDSGILMKKSVVLVAMIVCFLAYVGATLYQSCSCYFELGNKKTYYIISITSYFLFSALSLALFFVFSHTGYCWTFGVTMFLTHFDISFLISFLVFHIVVFSVVLVAPLHVDGQYRKKLARK